jgi:hypothetical protein
MTTNQPIQSSSNSPCADVANLTTGALPSAESLFARQEWINACRFIAVEGRGFTFLFAIAHFRDAGSHPLKFLFASLSTPSSGLGVSNPDYHIAPSITSSTLPQRFTSTRMLVVVRGEAPDLRKE